MLLYRVFAHLPAATAGQPGHPEYLQPHQGKGRLDNPGEYLCWYMSAEQSGAVGEVFGDLLQWSNPMFAAPHLPGSARALGTYAIPDDTPLVDLDDAQALLDRGLRPTQVIERNRPVTQGWALKIFEERNVSDGTRRWDGVRWWSYHRPQWRIFGLWGVNPRVAEVQDLALDHPAVIDAAHALGKPLP